MIEVIYNKEDKKTAGTDLYLKLPKNIRQIGEPDGKKKIYIEDYVVTWLHQLCGGEDVIPKAAVLLGEARRFEGVRYLFVNGALELEDLTISGDGIAISEEEWASVYERMKRYFDTKEIVGWFLGVNGFSLHITGDILKTHIDNFAGNDKLFMMYEQAEKEDGFFLFENGDLVRQPGFYIYFEKNPEMQSYMVDKNQGRSIEDDAASSDVAIREFRTAIKDKKEQQEQKKIMSFLYAASTFLVMIVLVMGITMVNNYDKMRNMEASLQVISNSVTSQNNFNTQESADSKEEAVSAGQVPVDSVEAGITKKVNEKKTDSVEAGESKKPAADKSSANNKNNGDKNDTDVAAENKKAAKAASTKASSSKTKVKTYVVKDGDTLASISQKFYGGVGMVKELAQKNHLKNSDKIYSGQKLIIP